MWNNLGGQESRGFQPRVVIKAFLAALRLRLGTLGRAGLAVARPAYHGVLAHRRILVVWGAGLATGLVALGVWTALALRASARETFDMKATAARLSTIQKDRQALFEREVSILKSQGRARLTQYEENLHKLAVRLPASAIARGQAGRRRRIALTFDDGPHAGYTERILKILQDAGIRATFFVVGDRVVRYPELLRQEISRGHEIGNHTYRHRNLRTLSNLEIVTELEQNRDLIRQVGQVETTIFRPPGGQYDDRVLRLAAALNYRTILWSSAPADHTSPPAELIEDRILGRVGNGVIILCHDGIEGTIAALPRVIASVRAGGYEFVTVSELLRNAN